MTAIDNEKNTPRVRRYRKASLLVLFGVTSAAVLAGPPFLTDDPEPVAYGHYEAYSFATFSRSPGSTFATLPAFEFNMGSAPNLQLHMVVPGAYIHPNGAYGMGDVEVGAKYRFLQEGRNRPQVAIFPLLELPSGTARSGLGNGHFWARLPVWVQKSYGPWTTYGGGGYQINRAPGTKDSVFAGWLVQRHVARRLTVGTEVYFQQAQTLSSKQTTFVDGGGYYSFRDNFSFLFMLGHTVAGQRNTVGYVGLYWTWGREGGRP